MKAHIGQHVRITVAPARIWRIESINDTWLRLCAIDDGSLCEMPAQSVEPIDDDALPVVVPLTTAHHWLCALAFAVVTAACVMILIGAVGVWRGIVCLPVSGPIAAVLYLAGFAGWAVTGFVVLWRHWRQS